VYELTEAGEALVGAIAPLARWGAARLGPRDDDAGFRAEWLILSLRAAFRPEAAVGVHDCYEFRVDGEVFWVSIDDGAIDVSREPPRPADFTITTDVPTLAALGTGELDPQDAVAAGRASLDGSLEAGYRALSLLGPGR
jgi:hypothetical protein